MSETEQEHGTGKTYTCQYCGQGPFTFNELGTHSRTCEARKKALAKQEAEKLPPSPGEIYKGEPDANTILKEILENHPDIPTKVREEIMSWAGLRGTLDPQMVAYLLQNMRGVSSQTANIVAQKYSLALQKAQQEGKIQVPFPLFPAAPTSTGHMSGQLGPWSVPMTSYGGIQYPPTTPSFWPITPTVPGMPSTVYPPTSTPFVTREELGKITNEREEKNWRDRVEGRLTKLDSDFAGALSKMKEDIISSVDSRGGDYEEIREYIDGDGKICDPDKAASMRIRRIPIRDRESKGLTAEEVRRIIREEKEPLTPEKVREIVRAEVPKKEKEEESPAIKELKDKLEDARKDYEDLKDRMDSTDRKRLEDTIGKLEKEIDTLRGEVGKGEYREDTFRMLDTSVRELGAILKDRKPMDKAVEILAPGAGGGAPPSGETVPAKAKPNLEELRKKGLVVRLVERVRG